MLPKKVADQKFLKIVWGIQLYNFFRVLAQKIYGAIGRGFESQYRPYFFSVT